MAVVARTPADYCQQLTTLLPPGPAWGKSFSPSCMHCCKRLRLSWPSWMRVRCSCWMNHS